MATEVVKPSYFPQTRTYLAAPFDQVAINWCMAKGTIPIPGAKTLEQVFAFRDKPFVR